jgi:hypothetical protein
VQVVTRFGSSQQRTVTLGSLVDEIERLDDNLTIYAEANPDWTEFSAAVACHDPLDGSLPMEAAGKKYFLEIWIAKEVIEVWKEWRGGRSPSSSEKCEAVIYYAKNDSYLSPESQV